MTTNFPASLDALVNPQPNHTLDSPSHSTHHTNLNDCIEALEAKVGVNSSAVATSHDNILTTKANIASPSFTGAVVSAGTVTAPTFIGALTGNATTVTTVPALTGAVTTTGSTNVTTIANAAVVGTKIKKNISSFTGATTYVVQDSDYILTHYNNTASYVQLPLAASWEGRPLLFRQIGTNSYGNGILSISNDVIPLGQISPSSTPVRTTLNFITSGAQGAWCELVSNGTHWVVVASNEIMT